MRRQPKTRHPWACAAPPTDPACPSGKARGGPDSAHLLPAPPPAACPRTGRRAASAYRYRHRPPVALPPCAGPSPRVDAQLPDPPAHPAVRPLTVWGGPPQSYARAPAPVPGPGGCRASPPRPGPAPALRTHRPGEAGTTPRPLPRTAPDRRGGGCGRGLAWLGRSRCTVIPHPRPPARGTSSTRSTV